MLSFNRSLVCSLIIGIFALPGATIAFNTIAADYSNIQESQPEEEALDILLEIDQAGEPMQADPAPADGYLFRGFLITNNMLTFLAAVAEETEPLDIDDNRIAEYADLLGDDLFQTFLTYADEFENNQNEILETVDLQATQAVTATQAVNRAHALADNQIILRQAFAPHVTAHNDETAHNEARTALLNNFERTALGYEQTARAWIAFLRLLEVDEGAQAVLTEVILLLESNNLLEETVQQPLLHRIEALQQQVNRWAEDAQLRQLLRHLPETHRHIANAVPTNIYGTLWIIGLVADLVQQQEKFFNPETAIEMNNLLATFAYFMRMREDLERLAGNDPLYTLPPIILTLRARIIDFCTNLLRRIVELSTIPQSIGSLSENSPTSHFSDEAGGSKTHLRDDKGSL